jgi:ferritin
MLSKKMLDALNQQINEEYYSSYLYLSMAAWAESKNLKGFGNWFRIQTQEEMSHAMKIFDYILDRGGDVELKPVAGPQTSWDSPLAAFEATLEHERHITGCINKLVDLAVAESDHATTAFLQWFVNEQVEEEANADEIVQQLSLMKDAPGGLFMLDRELAKRTPGPEGSEPVAE